MLEFALVSRRSKVATPALNPLPDEPFDLSQWSRARVNIDCHIVFDTKYYSVPYNLVHELVEVRSNPTTVEIFHKSQWVALHPRARGHGHTVTINEHRRRSHQAHLEWTPSRMVHWAQSRPAHRTSVRAHSCLQAASREGLSVLPGANPASRVVFILAHGSCRRACTRHGNLSLPSAAEAVLTEEPSAAGGGNIACSSRDMTEHAKS